MSWGSRGEQAFVSQLPFRPGHSCLVNNNITRRRPAPLCSSSSQSPPATSSPSLLSPSSRVASFLSRAGPGTAARLAAADAAYSRVKETGSVVDPEKRLVQTFDRLAPENPEGNVLSCDVLVAGGTLGVFLARALRKAGWKVAIVERGKVVGREQEWNISRDEMTVLVDMGLLGAEELETCIASEWNPSRILLKTGEVEKADEIFVNNVLNCGVVPEKLVSLLRAGFEDDGGIVVEGSTVDAVDIYEDMVVCSSVKRELIAQGALGAGGSGMAADAGFGEETRLEIRARLFVDCMGSFSPIAAQARDYARPDGICVTVGACCEGPFDASAGGDLLASIDPVSGKTGQQSFWEAFPASGGDPSNGKARRTSYMFQYGRCVSDRPSLGETLDEYLSTLPRYQGVRLEEMDPVRVLFGFFPAYRNSPLKTPFNRVFFAGDAGGCQSPVSFGGFASMLRHLPRITPALSSALSGDELSCRTLQKAAPYMPNQAATWLFAAAMSARGKNVPLLGPYGINRVLAANMRAMERLGTDVQRPFLQDVVQAGALARTLGAMIASDPLLAVQMLPHVGLREVGGFGFHFLTMIVYAWAFRAVEALGLDEVPSDDRSKMLTSDVDLGEWNRRRLVESLRYGSGRDHVGG